MIVHAKIIAIHLNIYSAVRIPVYLHFDKVQGAKVADLNCKTEVSLSIGTNGVTNGRRTLKYPRSNFRIVSNSGAYPPPILDRLHSFYLDCCWNNRAEIDYNLLSWKS